VLEARRHFAGLDRGGLFIGQIDGPKGPAIANGFVAPFGRTGLASRRRRRAVLARLFWPG
jgi:hypothetical protein